MDERRGVGPVLFGCIVPLGGLMWFGLLLLFGWRAVLLLIIGTLIGVVVIDTLVPDTGDES